MCVSTHSFFAGFVLPSPLNFNLKSCKRAHMTRVLMIVASNQEIVLGNADNLEGSFGQENGIVLAVSLVLKDCK